jgi:hypothetical protein
VRCALALSGDSPDHQGRARKARLPASRMATARLPASRPRTVCGRVMPTELKRDLSVTAHHEAGHIVARLIHGLTFDRAIVREDGSGSVDCASGPLGEAWGAAIRALSGPISESTYTDQPLGEILENQAVVDRAHAYAALAAAGRQMADAIDFTCELVTWAWPAITAIARVLEANGEIGQDEAIGLINATLADAG